ncbi:protein fluG-like isoform X2 [Prosopis cineraria]|uniref:protein fluG-like isoform X2 n=1 Tax=Prosopis cineraria TaxID=364024 RepID=UPI00240F4E92|nr:protein fluG-like isoform X2 [Prosopis cineraria]
MDFADLRRAVEEVELVDAHAHSIVDLNSNFAFIHAFSEAYGDAISFASHSLSFKRSLREIAELYGSQCSLQSVEEYRRVSGLQSICATCFKAAKISVILIDDGLELDKKHDLRWHESLTPLVGRILRIERLAEKILDEIFGLKSIAAYRSGLEINTKVTNKAAEEGLTEVLIAGKPVRITSKNLIDYIFLQSLEVAQSYDLPMQIHTGFGDTDLDMTLSNPLHLLAVLEDKRYSKCRIVLLHASYPFSREASYLASVYTQVYLDFGLAIPKFSVHGMISSVKELLELAPTNKVMFSTDGYAFPETFYLGAKKSREVVFSVLRDACIDGVLSVPEAVEAAKDIFARNAIDFYKIKSAVGTVTSHNNLSQKSNIALESELSLVRLIWVDISGQHRCRVVPGKRFKDVVKEHGVGLASACIAMPSYLDTMVEGSGLSAVGEVTLMPDLSTKRKIPWCFLDDIGSGVHAHLSLSHNGQNVFMASDESFKYGISAIGKEFMAGVLHHLSSLWAFIAPHPNSYHRLQPNTWSGAFKCWGNENKEAPIRAASPPGVPGGLVSNFEIKSFDATANPHLGLAAMIAAGIDGLRRHLSLPEPVDTDPESYPEKLQRLPSTLSESLEALDEDDDIFKEFIGEKLLTAIKAVRKAEINYFSEHEGAHKNLIYIY